MEFEQLGESWKQWPGGAPVSPVEALQQVQQRVGQLRRVVRLRDRLEIGIALVMLPLFGWLAVVGRTDVSRIGAAIIAIACLLIPIRLRAARHAEPDPAQPLLPRLRQELAQVEAQDRLLSSVLWWYLAPLGIGVVLFVGGSVALKWGMTYAAVVVILYAWIYRLNQRAVRTQLVPRARELQSWITHFEQER
jgi:hypothetical protein